MTLSLDDKEAVRKVIDGINANEIEDKNKRNEIEETCIELKKDSHTTINNENEHLDTTTHFKTLTDEDLLKFLKEQEESQAFVGLKHFVKNILGVKGYSYSSTYAQLNLLADKEKIEIYQVENRYSPFETTAVKINNSALPI